MKRSEVVMVLGLRAGTGQGGGRIVNDLDVRPDQFDVDAQFDASPECARAGFRRYPHSPGPQRVPDNRGRGFKYPDGDGHTDVVCEPGGLSVAVGEARAQALGDAEHLEYRPPHPAESEGLPAWPGGFECAQGHTFEDGEADDV